MARALAGDPRVRAYEGEPIGLLDLWAGADEVVLIDAVASSARAGTVHRLDPLAGPLPAGLASASTHAFGLAATIELARELGRLPPRLIVYGIEGQRFEAGAELSAPVAAAVGQVASALRERLAP